MRASTSERVQHREPMRGGARMAPSPTPPPMRARAICSLRRVFACSRLVSPDSSIQPLAHVSRPVVGARMVCGSSARTDTRWMAKPLSQAAGQQRKQAQERDRIRRRGITREQGSHTLTEAGQARMRTLFSPHTAPPFPPSHSPTPLSRWGPTSGNHDVFFLLLSFLIFGQGHGGSMKIIFFFKL